MITRFHVENYKALRDVTLELTPMHLLIGPNDSGKTSILEAIAALSASVEMPMESAFAGAWTGAQLVWNQLADLRVTLSAHVDHPNSPFEYTIRCKFRASPRDVVIENEDFKFAADAEPAISKSGSWGDSLVCRIGIGHDATAGEKKLSGLVRDALQGVFFSQWSARFLALPVAPEGRRPFSIDPAGFGLATCLEDIVCDSRERFSELENKLRRFFPQVKAIKLRRTRGYRGIPNPRESIPLVSGADGMGIFFEFNGGGPEVSAQQVSDGMLLVLGYLTVLNLPQPPRILLIEEPENGVHPKRLQDILEFLREAVVEQQRTQILMTSHSPYVVDLFSPDEVSLCQKESDGSVTIRRLSESSKVREQLDVFTLGEIWTAEGDDALSETAATTKGAAP